MGRLRSYNFEEVCFLIGGRLCTNDLKKVHFFIGVGTVHFFIGGGTVHL